MKACVLIPCYNHADTLAHVLAEIGDVLPVLVVDDGSEEPVAAPSARDCVRLPKNRGKAAALRAGFERARELGFTHAVTMDADTQHRAADLPAILEAAESHPEAIIVGVRDFRALNAPRARIWTNEFSNFWFRVETGVRLGDTQCGFRCYPLGLMDKLRVHTGRYAYELETLVRAAWAGTELVPVPIGVRYTAETTRRSHFRPFRDMAHISWLNTRLVWQAWTLPLPLRRAYALGEDLRPRTVLAHLLAEHTGSDTRFAAAVGLGLCCGILPVWGYQMALCAVLAHRWRLNKVIALAASNISIPPIAPLLIYASLGLGHWLLNGQWIDLDFADFDWRDSARLAGEYVLGAVVFALLAGAAGTLVAWLTAKCFRRR